MCNDKCTSPTTYTAELIKPRKNIGSCLTGLFAILLMLVLSFGAGALADRNCAYVHNLLDGCPKLHSHSCDCNGCKCGCCTTGKCDCGPSCPCTKCDCGKTGKCDCCKTKCNGCQKCRKTSSLHMQRRHVEYILGQVGQLPEWDRSVRVVREQLSEYGQNDPVLVDHDWLVAVNVAIADAN